MNKGGRGGYGKGGGDFLGKQAMEKPHVLRLFSAHETDVQQPELRLSPTDVPMQCKLLSYSCFLGPLSQDLHLSKHL